MSVFSAGKRSRFWGFVGLMATLVSVQAHATPIEFVEDAACRSLRFDGIAIQVVRSKGHIEGLLSSKSGSGLGSPILATAEGDKGARAVLELPKECGLDKWIETMPIDQVGCEKVADKKINCRDDCIEIGSGKSVCKITVQPLQIPHECAFTVRKEQFSSSASCLCTFLDGESYCRSTPTDEQVQAEIDAVKEDACLFENVVEACYFRRSPSMVGKIVHTKEDFARFSRSCSCNGMTYWVGRELRTRVIQDVDSSCYLDANLAVSVTKGFVDIVSFSSRQEALELASSCVFATKSACECSRVNGGIDCHEDESAVHFVKKKIKALPVLLPGQVGKQKKTQP